MPEEEQKAVPDLAFYSFPTLEQLSAASEAALRAEGFGYRSATYLALTPYVLQHCMSLHGCTGSSLAANAVITLMHHGENTSEA